MGANIAEAIKWKWLSFLGWFGTHRKAVMISAIVSVLLTGLGAGGYTLYQYSNTTAFAAEAIDEHTIVVNFNHYIFWDGENPEWVPYYPIEAHCAGINPKVGSFEFCLTKQIVLTSNVEYLAGAEFLVEFGGARTVLGRIIPAEFPIIPAGENEVIAEIVPFVPLEGVISSGFTFAGTGENSRIEVVTTPATEFTYSTDIENIETATEESVEAEVDTGVVAGVSNEIIATAKRETLVVGQKYTYQVLSWEEKEIPEEMAEEFLAGSIPAGECGNVCGNITFDASTSSIKTEKRVIAEGAFTVPDPLEIISQSPAVGASNVRIDTPIDIVFSKEIESAGMERLFTQEVLDGLNVELASATTIRITPKKPDATGIGQWEYGKHYIYKIDQSAIFGTDGSWLITPVVIDFTAIGEVKVKDVSPKNGVTGVGLGSAVTVSFDQEVNHADAEARFSISPQTTGSFSWKGNTLTFNPSSFKLLTRYSIKITAGVKSIYGLPMASEYSFSFTTVDRIVRTIGKSEDGRSIVAYIYGTGSKTVLYTSGLHGSERTSVSVTKRWNEYLHSNPSVIPDGVRVIVVEVGNPDGYARIRRFNSNNVDINRNWGTSSWTPDIYVGETFYPGGGGSAPFSEAETAALKKLIENEGVDTVVDTHCCANGVYGGSREGRSDALAAIIRQVTGYADGAGGWTKYPVTGSMTSWCAKNKALVAVTIEVLGGDSFSKIKPGFEAALSF